MADPKTCRPGSAANPTRPAPLTQASRRAGRNYSLAQPRGKCNDIPRVFFPGGADPADVGVQSPARQGIWPISGRRAAPARRVGPGPRIGSRFVRPPATAPVRLLPLSPDAGVAQLDRAPAYEAGGYRFESCHPRLTKGSAAAGPVLLSGRRPVQGSPRITPTISISTVSSPGTSVLTVTAPRQCVPAFSPPGAVRISS